MINVLQKIMKLKKELYAGNIKKKSSIKLMDEFESTTDGFHNYDTLVFGKIMNLLDEEIEDKPLYDISLYVKRYNRGDKIILSDITFTKLKKEFYDYSLDTLDEYDNSLEEVLQKIYSILSKKTGVYLKNQNLLKFFLIHL